MQSKQEKIEQALARLASDGWIERSSTSDDESWKTTRPWQRAMARTAAKLYEEGDPGDDLRVPIAHVLVEAYGSDVDDELLVALVGAMLPIEAVALGFR